MTSYILKQKRSEDEVYIQTCMTRKIHIHERRFSELKVLIYSYEKDIFTYSSSTFRFKSRT